jgi:hypothetical protein
MPFTTTATRVKRYRCCPICGRLRIGKSAVGWPTEAAICPPCSTTARAAIEIGVDQLSPGVEIPA